MFGCIWLFTKCIDIINRFKLKPVKYPPQVAFMGRKQSVDFNDTTLETWKTFIPLDAYALRSGDKEIVINDTVKINYGGFDSKESVKKFNSAEYALGFIDQAEEISRDDYGILKGAFRKKINNKALPYKILLTANPADCWLRDEFISGGPDHNAFVRALPSDNPFLPISYIDTLKEAFKHRPDLIDAYIYGKWDVLAGFDLVIKPSWVQDAIFKKVDRFQKRRAVVCDPARFGDDETVIYIFEEYKLIAQMVFGQRDTMKTAGEIIRMKVKYNCDLIGVDGCGVGGGVVDRIRELHHKVLDINSAKKPETEADQEKYYRVKDQMWWEAGELFSDGQVSIHDDPKLKKQLCSVKYKINSSQRIKVESSEDIKDRLGGASPDRAVACVMGLYTINHIPIKHNDFRRRAVAPIRRDSYGWSNHREASLHA